MEAMKSRARDYLLKDRLTRLNSAIERELGEAEIRRERRQTENALKEAQQRLLQAQKMEAAGQIAAGMAHEINNRLTAVLGHLDLCLRRVQQKSALHQALMMIQRNIRSIGKMNNKLLVFGQRQELFREPINLNQNLREIRGILKRRLLDSKINLELCLCKKLWKIYADSFNVDQAILNLIFNAGEAMPGGGVITITTENIYMQKSGGRKERYVCLSINDTGSGMDEQMLPRIFEPFYTTKECDRGTGLGLSVVYGIVKSHDGWIDVTSQPGPRQYILDFLTGD